jgi:hypothetical protein
MIAFLYIAYVNRILFLTQLLLLLLRPHALIQGSSLGLLLLQLGQLVDVIVIWLLVLCDLFDYVDLIDLT